jgi:ribosomal protein S18 acetylase RimI-like enzyme
MIVRRGHSKDDIPRLTEINEKCFEGVQRPPDDTFQQMLKISESFIAYPGNVGYNQFNEIYGFALVKRETYPYLWTIAVDPKWQHKGIAGNILREVSYAMKCVGEKILRLHVHVNNPAQRLYFNQGFRVKRVDTGYYLDEGDALLMEKKL